MAKANDFWVYILANRKGGTLYVGITSDLPRRLHEHQDGTASRFTSKYRIYRLVYFERFDDPEAAIRREKRLKKWKRDWKIALIEEVNPGWGDLGPQISSP